MSETQTQAQTWRDVFAEIPWLRVIVTATFCAVTATFAQILFTGESNAAITAGVTGAITAVVGMGGQRSATEAEHDADAG